MLESGRFQRFEPGRTGHGQRHSLGKTRFTASPHPVVQRLVERRVRASLKAEALTKIGIEPKTKELQIFYGGAKKADWDVGMAVDAVKMAPKPFLVPAFNRERGNSANVMSTSLDKGFKRITAKMAKAKAKAAKA